MLHGVNELLHAEYIDVEMVGALEEIAVQDGGEIAHPLFLGVSQSVGVDGLGVGDAVQGPLVGELGQGVEGGQKPALFGSIAGIGSGREGFSCFAPVRQGAGGFAVHHVGSDGEDGGSRLGIPVGVVLADLLHKGF